MLQKFPVNKFEWIEDNSQFKKNKKKKTIMKEVIKDVRMKMIFNILKNCMNFIMIYHFYQKEGKLKNSENILLIYMVNLNMLFT